MLAFQTDFGIQGHPSKHLIPSLTPRVLTPPPEGRSALPLNSFLMPLLQPLTELGHLYKLLADSRRFCPH